VIELPLLPVAFTCILLSIYPVTSIVITPSVVLSVTGGVLTLEVPNVGGSSVILAISKVAVIAAVVPSTQVAASLLLEPAVAPLVPLGTIEMISSPPWASRALKVNSPLAYVGEVIAVPLYVAVTSIVCGSKSLTVTVKSNLPDTPVVGVLVALVPIVGLVAPT